MKLEAENAVLQGDLDMHAAKLAKLEECFGVLFEKLLKVEMTHPHIEGGSRRWGNGPDQKMRFAF
jgi:hypothetical protein